MENKTNILTSTLEQMLADAEDNGRDGIQPKLSPDDVRLILKALNNYDDLCRPCAKIPSQTCEATTDIYTTGCKNCIHAPICEYCADHLENFSLPGTASGCDMYAPDLNKVGKISSSFVDTIEGMLSPDYKERFIAEYQQTKIRYEKLKAFNNKIEAARRMSENPFAPIPKKVEEPLHDCPAGLLHEQQSTMGQYLHILEVRAVIEGVELSL